MTNDEKKHAFLNRFVDQKGQRKAIRNDALHALGILDRLGINPSEVSHLIAWMKDEKLIFESSGHTELSKYGHFYQRTGGLFPNKTQRLYRFIFKETNANYWKLLALILPVITFFAGFYIN